MSLSRFAFDANDSSAIDRKPVLVYELHMEKHSSVAAVNTFNLFQSPFKLMLLVVEMTEWECELLCINNKHSQSLQST